MIKIICVGKIKEVYLKEAIMEYQKRLQRYTKLQLIEVLDSEFDDVVKTLSVEKERIEKYISNRDYIITLAIEGDMLDSISLAKKIDYIQQQNANIVFVIGGSYGLDSSIKKRANLSLSFSKLTFPHQLFRVLLLEQLYRSFKILHHESYHK